MQQLEIQYFFPLTEQIPLDLNYMPCYEYSEKKRAEMIANSVVITAGGTDVTWALNTGTIAPSFCIDIDQTPLTVVSKNKPNIFRKYLYKIMGVKWKAK